MPGTIAHPPLQGEGRTAEGGFEVGWRPCNKRNVSCAAPLSPPPGPLTRADLPPSRGR
jgi:hypothetical protein